MFIGQLPKIQFALWIINEATGRLGYMMLHILDLKQVYKISLRYDQCQTALFCNFGIDLWRCISLIMKTL